MTSTPPTEISRLETARDFRDVLERAGFGMLGDLTLQKAIAVAPFDQAANDLRWVASASPVTVAHYLANEEKSTSGLYYRRIAAEACQRALRAPLLEVPDIAVVLRSLSSSHLRTLVERLQAARGDGGSCVSTAAVGPVRFEVDPRKPLITAYRVPGYYDALQNPTLTVVLECSVTQPVRVAARNHEGREVRAPEAIAITIDLLTIELYRTLDLGVEVERMLRRTPDSHIVEGWSAIAGATEELEDDEAAEHAFRVTGLEERGTFGLELVRLKSSRQTRQGIRNTYTQVSPALARHWLERRDSSLERLDRELIRAMLGNEERAVGTNKVAVVARAGELLARLVRHPRVVDAAGDPLAVETGELEVRLARADQARVVFEIWHGEMNIGPALHGSRLKTVVALERSGYLISWDEARRVLWIGEASDVSRRLIRSAPGGELLDPVSEASLPQLLQHLPRLSSRVAVSIGEEIVSDRHRDAGRIVLRLQRGPRGLSVRLVARLAHSSIAHVPGKGPKFAFVAASAGVIVQERDFAAELRHAKALAKQLDLDRFADVDDFGWLVDDADEIVRLVESMKAADMAAEWVDSEPPRLSRPSVRETHVRVTSGRDWFGIGGSVSLGDDTMPLSDLLRAIRESRRVVVIDAAHWVVIDDKLRAAFATLSRLIEPEPGGSGRVSPIQALLVDDLAAQGVQIEAPKAFLAQRRQVEDAMTREHALPDGLLATLRPYQVEGFRWLARMADWAPGACLADDMGLGKTVQALALLLARSGGGGALVIAPTSLTYNWPAEAARFAPSLETHRWEPRRSPPPAQLNRPGSVVIVSYDVATIHGTAFAGVRWHTLVVDEAQVIKNAATQRAQAVVAIEADFRLALTGTPIENRTSELWSLFSLITPGYLGTDKQFARRFGMPIERHNDPSARMALARLVRPFVLRRLKRDVAPELPARVDKTIMVDLSPAEKLVYERVRKAALASIAKKAGGAGSTAQPTQLRMLLLAALMRIRQAASHGRLVDAAAPEVSSKMRVLLDLVDELLAEGRRILVFSQFTSLLDLVEPELITRGAPFGRLDGSTRPVDRQRLVDAYQDGDFPVFLLSLKAGGMGLNLTAADAVIHLDPWWNPAVEDQATDRAHRIGQSRSVYVIRLVTRATVEEGIIAMHEQKRELVDAMLAGTDQAATIGTDELIALVSEAL